MDFIDLLLIFVAGLVVGWWWHSHQMFSMLSRNPTPMINILESLRDRVQKEDTVTVIECRVEWDNDHCYIWDNIKGDFLGQGPDLESAILTMRSLNPNVEYHIPTDLAKRPN